MWRIPLSLFGGGGVVDLEFLVDTYIGDLWVYLGSPSEPVEVTVTVDSADVAAISVTNSFASGSTFQFTAVNGGRFIGVGGIGGAGGDDNDATGTAGSGGQAAGSAIVSDTFNINVDVDDGFLLGGGGGGGGGSFDDLGATGTPGGGGGGGVGWGDAAGGAAGSPTGSPIAAAGTAGTQLVAGSGGAGGSFLTNDGGSGGGYGLCGTHGQFANPSGAVFGNSQGNGGPGGEAGSAFYPLNGSVATFNGVKTQTTLRTENRIKGETDGLLNIPSSGVIGFHVGITHPTETYGWTFGNTAGGILTKVNSDTGNVPSATAWYIGNAISAVDYEVRVSPLTEGGNWDAEPVGTPGDWFALDLTRTWTITRSTSSGYAQALFEIRRTDETLAAASGVLHAGVEYEP